MGSETIQAIGVIAAAMVALLALLWGVMSLVTRTFMQQMDKWQQGVQASLDAFKTEMSQIRSEIGELRGEVKADIAELRSEVKADIAELRSEVKADIAAVNVRLDKQADHIVEVRGQIAVLSERMARVEERVGIPAEPVVTA